jgi:CRISPR-associated protein Csb1
VTLNLIALRRLEGAKNGERLRRYVLGLALVAATEPADGFLRQGCLLTLNPSAPGRWEQVHRDGKRTEVLLTDEVARGYAAGAAESFGVGPSKQVKFEKALAKADVSDGGSKKKPASGKAKS